MKKTILLLAMTLVVRSLLAQDASHLFTAQKKSVRTASQTEGKAQPAPYQDLNGLLNFSGDFKGLNIVPSINAWATQTFDSLKGLLSFQAFIGIQKHDSLLYNSALKLFLPEASQYGFSFKGQQQLFMKLWRSEVKMNALYIDWQANLLGKGYVYTDVAKNATSDESSLVFHPKLGLDYVMVGGLLDVYGHLNGLMRLTNVEKFDATFDNHKDLNLFFDAGFGVLANLNTGDQTKSQVYLRIGGILQGLDANSFFKTKDLLIPTFKVTLITPIVKNPQTVTKKAGTYTFQ